MTEFKEKLTSKFKKDSIGWKYSAREVVAIIEDEFNKIEKKITSEIKDKKGKK